VHVHKIRCGRADDEEVLHEQRGQSWADAIGTMTRSGRCEDGNVTVRPEPMTAVRSELQTRRGDRVDND
jgi:hypothetical protein